MKGFKILSKLGEGSYSTVLKVQRIADGITYALKRVKFIKLSEKERLNALNEIRILASVNDKNVISYKEAFFDEKDSSLGIVMEFADKGDLFQLITERKKTKNYFSEPEIWKTLIQLLRGLKSLHDLKILHRDIKSANVFLFDGGIVKLGDLNVSKVARKGLGYTQTGTPYYASPEVWNDNPYDSKSDIWSLGCVIYEMTTLKPPFQAQSMEELYKKVVRGIYPNISSRYSTDLSDILKLMIQTEVGARPSCEELLKMPIVTKRIEFFNETNDLEMSKEEDDTKKKELLKTITVPNNLQNLSKSLPKPNYSIDASNQSFQAANTNKIRGQYGQIITETVSLPYIKKDSIPMILKKNTKANEIIRNRERAVNNSEKKINSNKNNNIALLSPNIKIKNEISESPESNNDNNIKRQMNHKASNEKISIGLAGKNKPLLQVGNNINKGILLPNVYINRNQGVNINLPSQISKNHKIILNKSPNSKNKKQILLSYKIINSEGNLINNNPDNIKIINGDIISQKNSINNNRSLLLKKKIYQPYIVGRSASDEIGKILLEQASSGRRLPVHKMNIYSNINDDRNLLKILQQKKGQIMGI